MFRLLLALPMLAVVLLSVKTSGAQEGAAEGTLVVTVVYSPLREWDPLPARCDITVYEDLRDYTVPGGLVEPTALQLPVVARGRTNDTGRELFVLPAGRYSVARSGCEHWQEFALANAQDPYYPYQCCRFFEGKPAPARIKNQEGVWVLTVQHINLERDGTSSAYFEEWGEDSSASLRDLWLLLGGAVVGCVVIAGIAAVIRPRYAPASDAKNPKRYEPKAPTKKKAATFDDVFDDSRRRKD